MEMILISIAFDIIAGGYLFIYIKLKEIEITLKSLNENILLVLRTLGKIPEDMTGRINTLLKKEIIVKNVLRVP